MALPELLVYPDPRLREVSTPVEAFDDALRSLIAELDAVMRSGPAAVGIAAPQIGVPRRVVIVDASSRKRVVHHGRLVLINPRIVAANSPVTGREGCLSVPDHTGNVVRAGKITVEAQDERGHFRSFDMTGFEARVAQHEIDHLDGRLFIDRVVSRHDLFRRES